MIPAPANSIAVPKVPDTRAWNPALMPEINDVPNEKIFDARDVKLLNPPSPLDACPAAPAACVAAEPPVIAVVIVTTRGFVSRAWATSASQDKMAFFMLSRVDFVPENRSFQREANVSSILFTAFFQTSAQASASLVFFFSASVSLSIAAAAPSSFRLPSAMFAVISARSSANWRVRAPSVSYLSIRACAAFSTLL